MGGKHFLGKLLATIIAFLLIGDTTPAASELPPHGSEKMSPESVGIGRSVRMEKEEGKFPSIGKSLRPKPPSPPPPAGAPISIPKPPILKPPVISLPPPPPPPPPPSLTQ